MNVLREQKSRAQSPVVLMLLALVLLQASAPAAAQSTKEGEDDVTHSMTIVDRVMKMGDDHTAIFRELIGVSRNDKGSGMFHNMGIRCWGYIDIVDKKPSSSGRCVEMDADGDQIFHTFENKAGVGAHVLVGGTGKYKGISGEQAFSAVTLVKGPEGVSVLVIPLKARWKLP